MARNRPFLLVSLLVLLLIAAAIPGARWLDTRTDTKRPMYVDRELAAWLLYEERLKGTTITPMTITPDQTVTLASQPFQPSPGNTVEVKIEGAKFCVQVADAAGHHTGLQCWGAAEKPPMPNDTTIDY